MLSFFEISVILFKKSPDECFHHNAQHLQNIVGLLLLLQLDVIALVTRFLTLIHVKLTIQSNKDVHFQKRGFYMIRFRSIRTSINNKQRHAFIIITRKTLFPVHFKYYNFLVFFYSCLCFRYTKRE